MFIKFNVFGKAMSVVRRQDEWQLFTDSGSGVRARVYDVVIPSELSEAELGKYLGDIYHEDATDNNADVERLN